ncbi:MAG: hypothetical protein H0V07_12225 [Propionibacteriales bacterium]|nr:hypothetical protein [Propionibacteriales bacterium]
MNQPIPVWLAVLAVLVVAVCTWQLVAAFSDSGEQPADTIITGKVDSIDTDAGTICIGSTQSVECYAAPGVSLRPGQIVSVAVEKQFIDSNDPGKGTVYTIVAVPSESAAP